MLYFLIEALENQIQDTNREAKGMELGKVEKGKVNSKNSESSIFSKSLKYKRILLS